MDRIGGTQWEHISRRDLILIGGGKADGIFPFPILCDRKVSSVTLVVWKYENTSISDQTCDLNNVARLPHDALTSILSSPQSMVDQPSELVNEETPLLTVDCPKKHPPNPLPKLQLAIVLLLQVCEPITSQSIFPYINQVPYHLFFFSLLDRRDLIFQFSTAYC